MCETWGFTYKGGEVAASRTEPGKTRQDKTKQNKHDKLCEWRPSCAPGVSLVGPIGSSRLWSLARRFSVINHAVARAFASRRRTNDRGTQLSLSHTHTHTRGFRLEGGVPPPTCKREIVLRCSCTNCRVQSSRCCAGRHLARS